jgi:hypothetical protein
MNWTQAVDIYCERLGPGLWAEPLNALTNIAFFIAAWLAWRAGKARGLLDAPTRWLIAVTVCVGIGSTLFHTFAQRWAGAADVIPILLFIVSYFGLAVWRYFGAKGLEALALAVAFVFFANGLRATAGAMLPTALQPTVGYLPALALLLVCGGLLILRRHPAAWWLLGAAAVFMASLTFRSLDQPMCDRYPFGTHFLWHCLNGAVLGTLLFGWLRHGARPTAAPVAAAAAAR